MALVSSITDRVCVGVEVEVAEYRCIGCLRDGRVRETRDLRLIIVFMSGCRLGV